MAAFARISGIILSFRLIIFHFASLFFLFNPRNFKLGTHSTVTLLARLRGLSTSQPRATAR